MFGNIIYEATNQFFPVLGNIYYEATRGPAAVPAIKKTQ